jgi:hypothetical protein
MENGENWGDLRGLEEGGLMSRPEASFASGDPTDYPNWARILLELKLVEKRRLGFVPNGSETTDSTAGTAIHIHVSTQ